MEMSTCFQVLTSPGRPLNIMWWYTAHSGSIPCSEQMFFISFARVWARNIKPEAAVARVRSDPHSPNQYRADGTVFNIPEFAKAFKCSPKAKVRLNISKLYRNAHFFVAQPTAGEALYLLVAVDSHSRPVPRTERHFLPAVNYLLGWNYI